MARHDVTKVVIVGHVDHGKSTLIGRLLYDAGGLSDDRLNELGSGDDIDFANLTDQLREEREGDLTIDSAQMFFHTKKRRYVIIDTPGHVEFLKNMLTGASQADVAVLIVDANEGIMEQTRRHAYLLDMLGLKKVLVVANKMDLVGYAGQRFEKIKDELLKFLKSINIAPLYVIPISAKKGDNITKSSKNTKWYGGPALLEALDGVDIREEAASARPLRYPVQDVYGRRGKQIAVGRIESGGIKKGDEVLILPSGRQDAVASIEVFEGEKTAAKEGESIGITLKGPIAQRGEVVCGKKGLPKVKNQIEATIFWIDQEPFHIKNELTLKCATQEVGCSISRIKRRINSSTLAELDSSAGQILHSESAEVVIKAQSALVVDDFKQVKELGRFILERGFDVVGAGIIRK
jgi:sulfate adenylyltransferase large subunit